MGLIDYLNRSPSRARLLRGDVPRWIANSKRRDYIASVLLSAPPWVCLRSLRALQNEARWATIMNNELYVLDHIVPLRHPLVCGLTVPWNMRVIPASANGAKSNWWTPDQTELFP